MLSMEFFCGRLSQGIISDQRHAKFSHWPCIFSLVYQICSCPEGYACSLNLQVTVIMEILVRKCGFPSVELVTPDKYKRFIKSVAEVTFLFLVQIF